MNVKKMKHLNCIADAAVLLGISEATLRLYIAVGKITKYKHNGRVFVTDIEIRRYMADRKKWLDSRGWTKK